MRNLKRALSLALATVMTMGLMMVGTGASYKDVDTSDNQEAIEVLQAVGIMTGDENGNFNPDAKVTRNEMAVIMSNLLNLDYDYYRGTNPFTDVPEWAAPYVAACAAEGVTAGAGGNFYNGAGNVTAAEAALMVMKTLGYFQYQEDFGDDWQVATVRQASYIDLFDGINASAGTALTRNQIAQLVLNGLQSDMVYFTGDVGTQITIGDTTINSGYRSEYTAKSSSDKKYNTLVGGATDIDESDKYIIQLGEELYNGNLTKNGTNDVFGRPATTWTYKKAEIGTYAVKSDLVATYTTKVAKSDVYSDVGKSVYDDLCDNESTLTVYFDGVETVVPAASIDNYIEKNNSGRVNGTYNGDLTEIYVDKNHNVTIVTIRTYLFQASTDYDSKKETVTLTTDSTKYDTSITLADRTLEADDFEAIQDFAADDYILVTATKNNAGKYEVQSVAKAETVTEEITGYKVNENVVTGSGTYEYSATAIVDGTGIVATNYTVGKSATLVLDSYGYVIGVDEAVVLSDYVYISEFGSTSSLNAKAVANAIFTDGTYAEITVKEAYNKSTNAQVKTQGTIAGWGTTAAQIGWFTYSKNSDGEYTLYPIEGKYTEAAVVSYGASVDVSYNNRVDFLAGQSYLANDDTVVVVSDKDDDLTVYTGVKNIPEIKTLTGGSADVYLLHNDNNYASVVYIDVDGAATISGEKDANLVYVTKFNGTYKTTDNQVYYAYDVLVDGEKQVVKADNKINGLAGNIYGVANYITKNSDDMLTGFQMVDTAGAANGVLYGDTAQTDAITYSAGTLSIDGKGFVVAEDAAIDLIVLNSANALNKDKDAAYEVSANISAKELADALKGYTYTYDYALKTTESGNKVIKELYVTVTAATAIAEPSDLAAANVVKFKNYTVSATELAQAADATQATAPTITFTAKMNATQAAVEVMTVTAKANGTVSKIAITDNASVNVADWSGATAYTAGTYYVSFSVKSEDTKNITNYMFKLVVNAESNAVLVSSNSNASVTTTPSSEAITITAGAPTVADLYAVLSVSGGNAGDSFKIVNAWGTTLSETDTTTAVATGMKAILMRDNSTDLATGVEYAITVT